LYLKEYLIMTSRILWPALVLVAAAACADGAGPVDMPVEAAFDFAVPAFRQLRPEAVDAASAPTSEPQSVAASWASASDEIPKEFRDIAALGWLIREPATAEAGFPSDHFVAFGQVSGRSIGSYYRNEVNLTVRYGTQAIGSSTGVETAECMNCHHWHSPWGETANTTIALGGTCGHAATASGFHEAFLDFTVPLKGKLRLAGQRQTAQDHASQPPCPIGRDGYSAEEDWLLCFWEDVYDWRGEYMGRRELGCQALNAS
jgi:hypothetical protein